jgi:hypothetical protein
MDVGSMRKSSGNLRTRSMQPQSGTDTEVWAGVVVVGCCEHRNTHRKRHLDCN